MADYVPVVAGPEAAHVDPAERGRLTVQDGVVERLATYAAIGVSGVARHDALLDRAVGRTLPRANAQISGRIAAVDVELAVTWGSPLDDVASTVREAVRDRLETLAGLDVTRVNVTVKRIVGARAPESRVR